MTYYGITMGFLPLLVMGQPILDSHQLPLWGLQTQGHPPWSDYELHASLTWNTTDAEDCCDGLPRIQLARTARARTHSNAASWDRNTASGTGVFFFFCQRILQPKPQ